MRVPSIVLSSIVLLSLVACSDGSTSVDPSGSDPATATITIQNVGASAYRLVGIEGEGARGGIDEENPELELTIGGRFVFDNQGGASSHPLDFRNADRQKLFGQSNPEGLFDNDPAVAVAYEGNRVIFTLTPELSSALSDYVCSFHPSMGGALVSVGG